METPPTSAPRRRVWPWIVALCCAPLVIMAAGFYSMITLDHAASTLRRQVMAASKADWNTKVQLSIGRAPLWLLRGCLAFVPKPEVGEARAALKAVDSVSVGVYQLAGSKPDWSREELLNATDQRMRGQGWSRLVGVSDAEANVMVYVRDGDDDLDRLCVAVAQGQELVVASVDLDADALLELIEHHAGDKIHARFAALRH